MSEETVGLDGEDLCAIKRAYGSFWDMFQSSQGVKAEGDSDNIQVKLDDGDVRVEVSGYFKISELKYRRDRPDDLCDVCLQPELVICGREHNGDVRYEIAKSTTRVTYLRRQDGRQDDGRFPAEIKQGMRYEFELEPDNRHPIFHVHYDPTAIAPSVLSGEYEITNADEVTGDHPDFPRIPSPPMDFVGILYLIIKDHGQGEDATWPNKVLEFLADLPPFPKWCFDPSPQAGSEMILEWWYVHAGGGPHVLDEIIDLRCVE